MIILTNEYAVPIRSSFLHYMPETDTLKAVTEPETIGRLAAVDGWCPPFPPVCH